MSQTFKRPGFCDCCQTNVLAERESGISDGMGCLLIIITAGLFLPVFMLARFVGELRPFLCPRCGSKIKTASILPGLLWILALIVALIVAFNLWA